jgi:tRNA (mo5U34)-methyltransferase
MEKCADRPKPPVVGDLLNNLGIVAFGQGRADDAGFLLKQAIATWEQTIGNESDRVALGRSNLSAVYRAQGHYTEAEWQLQRALRIWDRRTTVLIDASETGLLGTADFHEEPLAMDMPDPVQRLHEYRQQVQLLRSKIDEGAPEASGDLERTVERLGPWYHNLQLKPGLSTNPGLGEHPASRWRILEPFVPKNLTGKTVLDIGCNAGYFSFEMKRRGASRVVGIDIMPHVLAQARFLSAWFDVPVELREMDTYDVADLGSFDFVVFVGVLYHLKHPLYALEKIASICRDTMLFQSIIRGPLGDFNPEEDYPNAEVLAFDLPAYPKLYFIEKSFNGDVSNWWFATRSCLKAMLRTAGFREIIDTASSDTFICRK